MSYGENVYDNPGKFDLETIGSIDWSDGSYCFDLTAVWRNILTRQFVYAEDSGCSCPSPFEDFTSTADLAPITSLAEFRTHLDAQQRPSQDRAAEIVTLVERLHELGLR